MNVFSTTIISKNLKKSIITPIVKRESMATHLRIYALFANLLLVIPAAAMEQSISGAQNRIIHASVACLGFRPAMEDESVVHYYPDGVLALVCDGHGGKDVAQYAIGRIPELLRAKLNSTSDKNEECIQQLISDSFEECDKEIEQKTKINKQGCTALLAYIREGKVYIANTGDSHAFLINQTGDIAFETTDHRPMVCSEINRLCKTTASIDRSRLYGTLAVSRAFGDFQLKKYDPNALIAKPDVFSQPFAAGDTLVMVTDGVTDVLESRHVSHSVRLWSREESWTDEEADLKESVISSNGRNHAANTKIDAHNKHASQLAIYLINKALLRNSNDNITALVLHHTGGNPCPTHADSDVESTQEMSSDQEVWDEDDVPTWY